MMEESGERLPLESIQVTAWDPLGKWTSRHTQQQPEVTLNYGGPSSYRLAAEFLSDCAQIEDWGCGLGAFKAFCSSSRYIGLDGSETGAAESVVDLRRYVSNVEGILLRHVLEHNAMGWREILLNAAQSFSKKMVLAFYTPFGDATRNVRRVNCIPRDTACPVAISFCKADIVGCFPADISWFTVTGPPLDKFETMFFLQKDVEHPGRQVRQEVSYFPNFEGTL
jgi:hypothetical protein